MPGLLTTSLKHALPAAATADPHQTAAAFCYRADRLHRLPAATLRPLLRAQSRPHVSRSDGAADHHEVRHEQRAEVRPHDPPHTQERKLPPLYAAARQRAGEQHPDDPPRSAHERNIRCHRLNRRCRCT